MAVEVAPATANGCPPTPDLVTPSGRVTYIKASRPRRPRMPGPEAGSSPQKRTPSWGTGPRWRAAVATVGGCAIVVAGALVVVNVHNSGQRVTIRPATLGRGPLPGTIFVADSPAAAPNTPAPAGPGSITVYRPGAIGNARPEAVITAGVNGPSALAFDGAGDLWVSNVTASTVVEYSRAELAAASPAATVTISGGPQRYINQPAGIAFDGAGNLWVTGLGVITRAKLAEYSRTELVKSGAPKPVVTIGVAPVGGNGTPCGIAFDRAGDLWGATGSVVTELSKAQLAKSAASVQVELSVNSPDGLDGPCGPTFDRAGDIWVGNSQINTVAEFPKAQVAEWHASGPPPVTLVGPPGPCTKLCHPRVVISSGAISAPGRVVFDRSGNLWVTSSGKNALVELSRTDITKSGSPAPTLTIAGPSTGLNRPWAVAFEP